MTSVYFPNVTSMELSAFNNCRALTTVDFPNVMSIGKQAFYNCKELTTVDFPNATSIKDFAFQYCSALTAVDFPNVTSIGGSAFRDCSMLEKVILKSETVCVLANTTAFTNTPVQTGTTTGFIYVPDNLVDSYKAAANWSTYASKIKPLSELDSATPTGYTVTIDDTAGFGYSDADVYQSDTASYNSTREQIGTCPVGESITVTVTKPYLFVETVGNSVPESVSGGISFNSSTGIYTVTGDGTIKTCSMCLTGDTLVTMADGSEKRIDEIALGEEILSYDFATMTLVPNKVVYTDKDAGKTHTEYDVWTFSDGSFVKTVHRHRFYNLERKAFVYMDEWQMGEHAVRKGGEKVALVSHERVEETVNHYKITGEKGTNYFANGLLTGDRYCPDNIEL